MIAEVQRALEELGHELKRSRFVVELAGGRKQVLALSDEGDVVRLTTIAASASAAVRAERGSFQLLLQNRYTELVQFGCDGRGRWIAETILPPHDVTRAEVELHVTALAAAADRLEQVVSGKDAY